VVDYLLDKHGKHIGKFGGRGLENAIEDELGHVLADQVLLADQYGQTKVCFVVKPNAQGGLLCHR
jgi:ATP-dependent Clp protease ATP-binding subunit ClpA